VLVFFWLEIEENIFKTDKSIYNFDDEKESDEYITKISIN